MVFFCQNNQWAISEPIERQTPDPALPAGPRLRLPRHPRRRQRRARDVRRHAGRAAAGPRRPGPDPGRGLHLPDGRPHHHRRPDPLPALRRRRALEAARPDRPRRAPTCTATGWPTTAFFEAVDAEADELGARLREGCKAMPDPAPLSIFDHVYAEMPEELAAQRERVRGVPRELRGGALMTTKVTLAKALNLGLRKAMEDDPKVLLMGEDVGKLGGVFRITDGLQKDFGEDRVIDSPLAESGIVGTAVGLALRGYRPVAEIQFDGFVYPAYDQIVCQVAKLHYRSQGRAEDADGDPDPLRRRHRRGRAPQRESRGAVRAHPGPEGGLLLQPGRRLLDDPAGHRLRRPGDLLGAQAAVPRRQGRPRRDRGPRPAVRLSGRAVRHRRDRAGLRTDGEDLPEGRGGGRDRGHLARR